VCELLFKFFTWVEVLMVDYVDNTYSKRLCTLEKILKNALNKLLTRAIDFFLEGFKELFKVI